MDSKSNQSLWHLGCFLFIFQVFEGILRVSYLHFQLCEVGEINYLSWEGEFRCSKIESAREELLKNIEGTCEKMEHDLKQWKEAMNGKRHKCYSLNHFTMKQILHLRKELARACTGQVTMDGLPLQVFMLLESVNRNIDPLVLAKALRTTIPENSISLTEEGFEDELEYFESDTIRDSVLIKSDESDEEEINLTSRNTRTRDDSLTQLSRETFTNAKETVEELGYTEEYLLAALQHCGRGAKDEDLVAWVVSCDYDEEDVMKLYEEAKENSHFADLLECVFGLDCHVENYEETSSVNLNAFER